VITDDTNATPAVTVGRVSHSERQSSSWDIRNAPRNYLSLIAFQISSAAFSFATVWLITRFLGSEGYGGVVAVIAASQVAQVLVNWTSAAVVRFGADEFVETAAIARTFWVRLIILVLNLAAILAVSPFWFAPLAGWLKLTPAMFGLVVAHLIVTVLWVHIQMSLQGAKMIRVQGLLQMLERGLIFAAVLCLAAAHALQLSNVVICYIAAPAVMAVFGLFKVRSLILSRFSVDKAFVKTVLAYSVPLLPLSLVGYFSGSYVDAIFISSFLSTRDLGIYSVAAQINGMVIQFPTLVNGLLVPFFVTLDKEGAGEKLNNYFANALPNLTLGWGMLCSIGALAASFVIPLIFGNEFAQAAVPFWILSTSTVIAMPILCGYGALTHARSITYIAAISTIMAAAANIGLNYLLIPRYGMAGCAWATVLAYLLNTIGFAVLLKARIRMPVSWVFLAIVPNLAGAVVLSISGNGLMAAGAACGLFLLILVLKRRSMRVGFDIMKRLVKMPAGV
jgi:O-antigen/teichoic acid export membrane protein